MKETFINYLKFEKRVSHHTLKSYNGDLNQFLKFYKIYSKDTILKDIDHRSIRSWIVDLSLQNLSNRSINKIEQITNNIKSIKSCSMIDPLITPEISPS